MCLRGETQGLLGCLMGYTTGAKAVVAMELSFFHLKSNPFVNVPTPDRLFRSRSYLRSMQAIAYGIEGRRGLIALFAKRGVGKTTLLRAYLAQRLQRNIQAIWLTGQSSNFPTILDRVCAQCSVAPADGELEATLRRLRAALMREADAGRRVVLLIDEAESLPPNTLEGLLALADMADGVGRLLTVVLIGEPVLDRYLKRLFSQTLRMDTYRRIHVDPLRRKESLAYVQHRIAQVSTDDEEMFTPGALRRVVRYAQGNPGLLNYVCNESLRAAIIEQQKPISKPIVRAVLNELEGRQPVSLLRWGLAALVGVFVIGGVSMGSPQIGQLWPQPKLASMLTELVAKVTPDWWAADQAEREASPVDLASTAPSEPLPLTPGRAPADSEDHLPILKADATSEDKPLVVDDEVKTRPTAASDTDPSLPSTELTETPASPVSEPAMRALDNAEVKLRAHQIANASLLCLTARPPGNHARDIILVDYNGKVQQRLVADGALNLSPILSPDQRHLAYTSYREGSPTIYVRDLKSEKDERLTLRAGFALPGAWSPDGRYLALSKSESGNSDIFLYDLKRRHMRRLTQHDGIDVSPSFAPDNTRLVFTSSRSGTSQVYLTDVNGRSPKRLTSEGQYNAAPVWAPQGEHIAFIGRSPEQTLELYVILSDGTGLRRVTIGGSTIEDAPTWSPDGQSILYTRVRNGIRERRIVDIQGQNDRELPGHGQVCYSPQWVTQLTN